MKLWKNFSLEKKSISRQDNIKDIMSFKSTNLINHVKKNMSIKKVTFESKKSSKNSLSSSFSDDAKNPEQNQKIQDETENEKNAKTIQINLAQKKFNDMKKLSSSDLFSNNKEKKLKNVYPTISNFYSQKKDNLFKIKIKKPKSQSNYNNHICNYYTYFSKKYCFRYIDQNLYNYSVYYNYYKYMHFLTGK